ncbi:hypothetical protein Tco_0659591, partial [Tanacetum coccineum]
IQANEDITLVNVQDDADKEMYDVDKEMYDVDKEMYDVGTVTGDEVFAE